MNKVSSIIKYKENITVYAFGFLTLVQYLILFVH